jgi:RNA polymerase sigma-70 factor (ECF subfamily)
MDDLDHLFRREAGRMVAALTRVFGVGNLPLVEDVVQEALCRALETWKLRGIPDNPTAWLLTTARRCALDAFRRERTARDLAPDVSHAAALLDDSLDDDDALLRMMFSCCQPEVPEEAQVALVLHILCGFSVAEIAGAFLTGAEAIKKRIARGKAALAASQTLFDLSSADLAARLDSVQRALYLLFNEGYHGASAVRAELCEEAMRLCALLCENTRTATPSSQALLALMCLHAARLPARLDADGDFTLLLEQDRALWDERLIAEGQRRLEAASAGGDLTPYHVEAAIASVHAWARRPEDTAWATIVTLYDVLLHLRPSPVVALGRALAIAERDGPDAGLAAVREIDADRLAEYPFYRAALGELELKAGRPASARVHFAAALELARNPAERRLLERRLTRC